MAEKQKAAIWVAVFIFAAYLGFTLADRTIFPQRQIAQVHAWRKVHGIDTPYDRNGRRIEKLHEANPWDAVIKISLLFVVAFSYWKILGIVVPQPGVRAVVFLISIPIAYIAFVYIAFATQFR